MIFLILLISLYHDIELLFLKFHQSSLEMVYLTKVLLLILTASLSVDCVIDRTYFIYLGLPISATSSDIQKAYDQKKIKI